ncbi:HEPN domain protein [Methanococcus vannielii SB]|uniref:HEPN domain protein n=1 Tax=Methanococcus vannielii (strain ATCC 35089 / DSM 1224 / JCM 13029 / OCM 148 / SB) TaxID=406327 RepID=A6USV8_METVS|nr:HEPN domain-containing protein [Methanococcus vannielii]ABR55580.1 HEPN domain protein [Methanococcus vannielii SB]
MLNVEEYFKNKSKLERNYEFHISKKTLSYESHAKSLVNAHVDKAKHNLSFVNNNLKYPEYNDWSVVGLYYAAYHAALSLLAKKNFISKSHNATVVFLIRHYTKEFSEKDIQLIDELLITKKDLAFYTALRSERQNASYSTDIMFGQNKVRELLKKTVEFVNKVDDILEEI